MKEQEARELATTSFKIMEFCLRQTTPEDPRLSTYLQNDPKEIRDYYQRVHGFTPVTIVMGENRYVFNADELDDFIAAEEINIIY